MLSMAKAMAKSEMRGQPGVNGGRTLVGGAVALSA